MKLYYQIGRLAAVLLVLLMAHHQGAAQASIQTDTVIPTSLCPGGFLIVPFSADTTFGPGNRFYAEWSDANGNFSNPDTIGSIPFMFGANGIVPANIPNDVTLGINYRVRVVSSDPPLIGNPSPNPIVITYLPFLANISPLTFGDVCTGEPFNLIAGIGFGGSSYAWSNGGTEATTTVTEPGSYTVTVTDLVGCEIVSDPFTVDMLPRPDQPLVSPSANGVLLTNATGVDYQWYASGNAIPGATQNSFVPDSTGYYSLVTTNADGCVSLPSVPIPYVYIEQLEIDIATGNVNIHDTISGFEWIGLNGPGDPEVQVLVYPNPTSDYLEIDIPYIQGQDKVLYTMYDASGKLVYQAPRRDFSGSFHERIDMRSWSRGLYNLHLQFDGRIRHYHILKEN